ncbi:MAG: hypothetical protein HYR64_01810 [Fimbriimonas ginsengisoli]|uniref:Carbohydrate kinase PfkB domain-containing protein n=1 Tax=Fimbriimonas ginsengisoli TaxID=1005039 RepID=A0A931LQX4_FIMGI|nr:hypothetical protein [Fimbriimonas ginsengisoli]
MRYRDILDQFQNRKALVVGDLMLDEYVFGRATRISPEAPVMVVRQQSTKNLPGGAANVARNLIALGAKVSMVGVVGCDQAGETLEQTLVEHGVEIGGVVREPDRTTTRKMRVLADTAHQVLRIDHEDERDVSPKTERRLLDQAEMHLVDCDVVIVSDYLKGSVTPEIARRVIDLGRKRGIPVVANPKPQSLEHYRGCTLLSLNRYEAGEAVGAWRGLEDADALGAARTIRERIGVEAVLITLGESGMVVDGPWDAVIPAPRVEVYDTAGAGDTVVATVALGLSSHGFERSVFTLAAQTAASVVRRVGVATPAPQDLADIAALRDGEVS